MDDEIKAALDAFIEVADEVLLEGNVESHGMKMIDAYVELRGAMGRQAVGRLKEYMDQHPEVLGAPREERN